MRQKIILIIIQFLKTVDNNKILFKLVTTYQHLQIIFILLPMQFNKEIYPLL